jgi:3-hydroxyisobutyrate dehydrogenase-like beta-hydroxyacid dehydrogenase
MFLLSEAHTLAEKAELPASVLESLIEQNFGAYAYGVSKRLTSGAYYPEEGQAPTSGLELGIKDVGHGVSVAREKGMRLEIGELSMGTMEEAKRFGDERGRRLDSSSVFGVVRQRAGLEFETEGVRVRDAGGK